ncbi:MAG: energy-coupling factor ABC transporter ATP-binding protein [Planctomycetota bacterium]
MSAAIAIEHLHYRYADGTPALEDVCLTIAEGKRWGIAGANGSGKSTLLHHVAGVHSAEGHLKILGEGASRSRLPWIRARVGLLFQNPDDQLFLPSVREDVAFGPLNLGLSREEVERRVAEAIGRVGLTGLETRPPQRLSGGEKRAAALATILALEPRILALDEPTNDLDPRGRRRLIEFLRAWRGTLVIASHDLEMLLECCGSLAILHQGRVVATGEPQALLCDGELLERHHLEVPPSLRFAEGRDAD